MHCCARDAADGSQQGEVWQACREVDCVTCDECHDCVVLIGLLVPFAAQPQSAHCAHGHGIRAWQEVTCHYK